MRLHLARSHTRTLFGGHRYTITAQLDCDPAERAIIAAHSFLSSRLYTAPVADELLARADAAYERQKKRSVFNSEDQLAIIGHNIAAIALYSRAANAFHITVGRLLDGCTITSASLSDLLAAERAITDAFETLSRLTAHAHTFDQGAETVLVPDVYGEEPDTAPPATWPDFTRI